MKKQMNSRWLLTVIVQKNIPLPIFSVADPLIGSSDLLLQIPSNRLDYDKQDSAKRNRKIVRKDGSEEARKIKTVNGE
jgi:hypothetical protein